MNESTDTFASGETQEILDEEAAQAGEEQVLAAGEAQADQEKKDSLPEIPVSEPLHVKSQEELNEALARHAAWIRDVLDPRVRVAIGRANFRGVDLTAFNLAGVDLSGADLSDADLRGVDLSGANLTVANLRGAKLQAADLRGAKLNRAKVDGADFRGADLTNASLVGVDMSTAILKDPESRASKAADSTDEAKASDNEEERVVQGAVAAEEQDALAEDAQSVAEELDLATPDATCDAADEALLASEPPETETHL